MMSLEVSAALRIVFSRTGRSHRTITDLSIIGIGIAVTSLLIVMSIVNGFRSQFADSLLRAEPNIIIRAMGRSMIAQNSFSHLEIEGFPGVERVSPFFVQEVLVANGSKVAGGIVRGVEESRLFPGQTAVIDGKWPALNMGLSNIALGKELASRIEAVVGDTVLLATFLSVGESVSFASPKVNPFEVSAILDLGVYQYNNSVCLTELVTAQKFYRLEGQITGLEVRVHDPWRADLIADVLSDSLSYPFYATSWKEMNEPMFAMLALQKKALFLVLTMMVVVAAANVVSGLTALVSVRRREIAIMMAMGMQRRSVVSIFLLAGLILGGVGLGIGLIATLLLVAVANSTHLVHLAADVYQIDYLPLSLQFPDVLLVCATTLAISMISTIVPSRKAGKLLPAEILRYE